MSRLPREQCEPVALPRPRSTHTTIGTLSKTPKGKPVTVSFTRLLCTRTLPWLAALTAYRSVSTPAAVPTDEARPKPISHAPAITVEAVFSLYDTVRRGTQPRTTAGAAATSRVSMEKMATPADAQPALTSSTALTFLHGVCTDIPSLFALHCALTQSFDERRACQGDSSDSPPSLPSRPLAASQSPALPDAVALALEVLSASSTLLNTSLAHATEQGTPEALRSALETLHHFHTHSLFGPYVHSLRSLQPVMNSLKTFSSSSFSRSSESEAHPRSDTTMSSVDWALMLGLPPSLTPLFTYALDQWSERASTDSPPHEAALDDRAENTMTTERLGDCASARTTSATGNAPTTQFGAVEGRDEEDAAAEATRAILRTARRLQATHSTVEASQHAHQLWLRRASEALLSFTAQLLSAAARGDVAAGHITSSTTPFDALVDQLTRTADFEETEQVLTLLSHAWASCAAKTPTDRRRTGVDDRERQNDDSAVAAAALQRAVVLVLARAVDRAPTSLHAWQSVERHWRGLTRTDDTTGVSPSLPFACCAGVHSAQGLLATALPVVRALSRRPFETHQLRQWWERVVLASSTAPRVMAEVESHTRQPPPQGLLNRPGAAASAWPSLPTASSLPLSEAFWSTLLRSSRDAYSFSDPSQSDLHEVLDNILAGALLLFQQALQQPEPSHAVISRASVSWFAELCTCVHAHAAALTIVDEGKAEHARASQSMFDELTRFVDKRLLFLVPTEAERTALLGQLLLALVEPDPSSDGDGCARDGRRRVRQALLQSWMRGASPSNYPTSAQIIDVGQMVCETVTHWAAPRTRTDDATYGVEAASASLGPLFVRLDAVVRAWIVQPPHRMAEAVYLLDDLAVALTSAPGMSRRGQRKRELADLTARARCAMLGVGLARSGEERDAPADANMEMASVWAALLATFTHTHTHTQLFRDVERVVLFYWLLDALAQATAHAENKDHVVMQEGVPLLPRAALESAARGVASVLAQSPVTSVLPPMLLNWLVSPEGLQMPWRAATQFIRHCEATSSASGASSLSSSASLPGSPPRGFLFLALPLDAVRDYAHAVRVLLALHYVTSEMEARDVGSAADDERPLLRTQQTTEEAHTEEAIKQLYARVRAVLLYTWYTRSLAAVLQYFAAHPDQLQFSVTHCGDVSASREADRDAQAASTSLTSLMMTPLDSLEKAAAFPVPPLRPHGSRFAQLVSTSVLCQYVLRERCAWRATEAVLGVHDGMSGSSLPDTFAPSHALRTPVTGRSTPVHARPASLETSLNEHLLREYVNLFSRLAHHDGGHSAPSRPPSGDVHSAPLPHDDRRLLRLLYEHVQQTHRASRAGLSSTAPTRTATQRAAYLFLHPSHPTGVNHELSSTRMLSAAAFTELCVDMHRLTSTTERQGSSST